MFYLLGLAAYAIPICLTWFGVCKLHTKTSVTRLAMLGTVILTVTAAILLHALKLFEPDNNFLPQGGGDFSDTEIARAVAYMANNGGAKFEEPKAPAAAEGEKK